VLTLQILLEFMQYDIVNKLGGFRRLHASVKKARVAKTLGDANTVARVVDAVTLASCFYFKPVLCMQRAVVTTRLLRKQGVAASLIIGYRPSPFFSHAWVEVNGRIVNDSPAYQEKLLVLERV
jgi:hypothetical protein